MCRDAQVSRFQDEKERRKYPKPLAPDAAPQKPGYPRLGACLSRCSEGTSVVPAGARARSLSRPFGLNFACAPGSACFKGRKPLHPPQSLGRRPEWRQEVRATHDSMDGGGRTASGTAVEEQLPAGEGWLDRRGGKHQSERRFCAERTLRACGDILHETFIYR